MISAPFFGLVFVKVCVGSANLCVLNTANFSLQKFNFDVNTKYNDILSQLKLFSKVGIEKLMEHGPELLPEAMKVVYYYGKIFQS